MDKWLAQIGLKGRALQIASKACEENVVEDLSLLNVLAKDDKQFEKAFPQAIIRTMILNALKENTSDQQTTEVKQEHETDNRYADDLCNRITFVYTRRRNSEADESENSDTAKPAKPLAKLPPSKRFHYFA